ncbi:hypothetical protein GCM10027059_13020 [Myceligenerans halotolerans]
MTLPKVRTPTLLADQVYGVLHESIISGELPAGSRLRVRDLAEQVGAGVMPVREAIRRPEEAGLAERVPHKGAVVKGLTLEELVHVHDVHRIPRQRVAAHQGAPGCAAGGAARRGSGRARGIALTCGRLCGCSGVPDGRVAATARPGAAPACPPVPPSAGSRRRATAISVQGLARSVITN